MISKIKNFVKNFLKGNLFFIFLLFLLIGGIIGIIFTYALNNPNDKKISDIISKFSMSNYILPYYVAERYIIWLGMREFLFWLNFSLSLFSIIASLMTVYFVAKEDEERKKKHIIFLSLFSICLTVASLIVNPARKAFAVQHAWRELDACIIQTINNDSLSNEIKNKIIADKIIEMERYIELKED